MITTSKHNLNAIFRSYVLPRQQQACRHRPMDSRRSLRPANHDVGVHQTFPWIFPMDRYFDVVMILRSRLRGRNDDRKAGTCLIMMRMSRRISPEKHISVVVVQ